MSERERGGEPRGDDHVHVHDLELELAALQDILRRFGYEIEPAVPGAAEEGAIVARRDLGDRAILLAIDVSGRFRVAISWVAGEWPSRDEIAGVPVRVVDAVSRAITVTGQVARPGQMAEVVAALGDIIDWAVPLDPGATLPPPDR